jgi:biopolymer transport protein ExbD
MSDALDMAQEEHKADMTPMIDVVFLMIIFFICIEFKVLEAKLPAYLPKDRGSARYESEPKEQLSVQVHVVDAGTKVAPTGFAVGDVDAATLRPVRHTLVGHRVRWQVGPKILHELADVQRELQRIADDPSSLIRDKTGERRLMACVIDGQRGTCYDDIARTTDACRAAGFADVHFGGGRGTR